jgi:hypothetical protein
MELKALTPPFRNVVGCVAFLVSQVVTTAALVLAAIQFPLMSNVFISAPTHGTRG